jgi:hypothetical protein
MRKFNVGDKVIPISKTDSFSPNLKQSGAWRRAQSINQPFLYVTSNSEDDDEYLCRDTMEINQGDYFCERDLVLYDENTFHYGDIVQVRDNECDSWAERCFITKIPNNMYPYICVGDGLDMDNYKIFLRGGEKFSTALWRYCQKKQIPQWKPTFIGLNENHTAEILENKVKVGCQEFSFDAIHTLYNEVIKAENFSKENS